MTEKSIWKRKFAWVPYYVDQGDPKKFGLKWLTFLWFRQYETGEYSRYQSYWKPTTHKWDD